jgi:hypothetical protein
MSQAGDISDRSGPVPPTVLQTVTTQDGIATVTLNNLDYNGYTSANGSAIGTTHAAGDTFQYEDRTFLTEFVVDPSATLGIRGSYSTIQSAITAAPSGSTVFIRPGTYTEDLTLKAGVSLQGFDASQTGRATVIVGNCSASFAGTCNISGVTLRTNGAAFLTVSGANATILNIYDSYLDMTNATGIVNSGSGSPAIVNIRNCNGNIGTTGISLFTMTNNAALQMDFCEIGNSGGSTTASTSSSPNSITLNSSQLNFPISVTSTGSVTAYYTQLSNSATALTTAGTGICSLNTCYLSGLTASAIDIGAGTTVVLANCTVNSSNTNAITGTGNLDYGQIVFDGNSSKINDTLTQTQRKSSCFQALNVQDFTANGTYTPTSGMRYCIIEVWGGGGGGAGCPATGAGQVSAGGGGGGGGYRYGVFSAQTIGASQAVTVGTGGAGGVGNAAGAAGNTSSVGALISAGGGSGGANAGASAITAVQGGNGGGAGAGGSYGIEGEDGGSSFGVFSGGNNAIHGGNGGSSAKGGGGASAPAGTTTSSNGSAGVWGAGGSGAANTESQSARNGGAGGDGRVVITEFA